MAEKPKIIIRNLQKTFQNSQGKRQEVLSDISLTIFEGEFICILGPSGCGKTTLLNLMAGFDRPTAGEVLIDGRPVTEPNPKHLTIFQNYGLFPWRTVLGNVAYGLEVRGIPRAEREGIALDYIRIVGLEDFYNHHPHELSGGMQQRVAIARALAVNPEILFMDEPFGSLDAFTRLYMQEEIVRLWQERQTTIVFVTHDIEEAVYLADRIVVMSSFPGCIRCIIPVPMGRPRDRTDYDFIQVRDHVYGKLQLKQTGTVDYYI